MGVNVLFIVLLVVTGAYVLARRFDMFSVALICLLIYNIYCATEAVHIYSRGVVATRIYDAAISPQVYAIVIVQVVVLLVVAHWYDHGIRKHRQPSESKFDDATMFRAFLVLGVLGFVIMAVNVGRIGLAGLTAEKAEVWEQTGALYVTGLWMSMAVFAYAMKSKHYGLLALALPPVLIHLFIGSRAYIAVVCIVALLSLSTRGTFSIKRNVGVFVLGFFALCVVMVYKKIYLDVKAGDFAAIAATLADPDTYLWIFRWGEPRIVLADLNLIVGRGLTLSLNAIVARIVSIVPFLNDIIVDPNTNLYMSRIVRETLNANYGVASNFWGECYAIGSYPVIAMVYAFWVWLVWKGNELLYSDAWYAPFFVPLISYLAFYIHRMDMVNALGNAKMLLLAMVVWWFVASLLKRDFSIGLSPKAVGDCKLNYGNA